MRKFVSANPLLVPVIFLSCIIGFNFSDFPTSIKALLSIGFLVFYIPHLPEIMKDIKSTKKLLFKK